MFAKPAWMIPTAFTVLFLICAPAFRLPFLAFPAGVSFVIALFVLYRDFRPRDKYDLRGLVDAQDKADLQNLGSNVGVFEFDDYLCHYCRTRYSMELRKCPKCGRARTS